MIAMMKISGAIVVKVELSMGPSLKKPADYSGGDPVCNRVKTRG
jgi:hypothetical protein